jgi:hypothetical protein
MSTAGRTCLFEGLFPEGCVCGEKVDFLEVGKSGCRGLAPEIVKNFTISLASVRAPAFNRSSI